MNTNFIVQPIGTVRSPLKRIEDCPLQGSEGAPEAVIEINAAFMPGIETLSEGSEVILLTWFHQADRNVLKCHMRNETQSPQFGVFSTRSPDRPNPIGLHRVKILEKNPDGKLKVFPLEALDGTPIIDIKPVLKP